MEVNPYAPPQVDIVVSTNADEELRRTHIHRETLIRTLGMVYFGFAALTGIPLVIGLLMLAFWLITRGDFDGNLGALFFVVLIVGSITVANALTGLGLLTLRKWGATIAIVTSILGLFAFPVGTAFSAFMLYLLFSSKTERIFAKDYPRVIAATAAMRYPWTAMLVPAIGFVAVSLCCGWLLWFFSSPVIIY